MRLDWLTLSGDWSDDVRRFLRFSCCLLLFLLPLNSFAQAHLWKHRPFRATDTEHSGGDHICDLRRDCDGDGRPDRLGDFVRLSGTVIAEPSTFETGGWIFWIRDHDCGVMVYGEPEDFTVGDYVDVRGWLRITNGDYSFPETGLATLGDIAVENGGTTVRGRRGSDAPEVLTAAEFCAEEERYGGCLVTVSDVIVRAPVSSGDGDVFVRVENGDDSLVLYLDADTGCIVDDAPGTRITLTGVVVSMKMPPGFGGSPTWCIAPRCAEDIASGTPYAAVSSRPWGNIKAGFAKHGLLMNRAD
jgi:hypothetical protein